MSGGRKQLKEEEDREELIDDVGCSAAPSPLSATGLSLSLDLSSSPLANRTDEGKRRRRRRTRATTPATPTLFLDCEEEPILTATSTTTQLRESEDESVAASESTIYPESPDGGYGWIVVAAAFLIHFLADGVSFSFGILYPEIQQYFGATKGQSAVVGSLFLSMPLLSGPLASALTDKYDSRPTIIVGGLLAAVGFLLSRFVGSDFLWLLYVTFGIVSGLGLGFCFNASIVAVTYYFEKRRALATGIAVCGSGIGTFVFAPFIEFLLVQFGWQGALLILAGALLNLVTCGMLVRDLEWPQDTVAYKRQKFDRILQRRSKRQQEELCGPGATEHGGPAELMGHSWQRQVYTGRAASLLEIPTFLRDDLVFVDQENNSVLSVRQVIKKVEEGTAAVEQKRCKSATFFKSTCGAALQSEQTSPEVGRSGRTSLLDAAAKLRSADDEMAPRRHSYSLPPPCRREQRKRCHSFTSQSVGNWADDAANCSTRCFPRSSASDSSLAQGFVRRPAAAHRMTGRRVRLRLADGTAEVAKKDRFVLGQQMSARVPSAPEMFSRRRRRSSRRQQLGLIGKLLLELWDYGVEYGDLLKSAPLLLFLLNNLLLYAFYDIPYVNLPEYAAEKVDASQQAASGLVSVLGVLNTVGMLLCGLLADRTRCSKALLYGCSCVICGGSVLAAPWLDSQLGFYLLCALFGFFISVNYTLSSVILLDIVGMSDFCQSYGLLCLVEGIGTLVGPALAGYLYDWTGDYKTTFIVGGCGIIISGLLMFVIVGLTWRRSASGDDLCCSLCSSPIDEQLDQ